MTYPTITMTKTTKATPKTLNNSRLQAHARLLAHPVAEVAATVAETAATIEITSTIECPNANRDDTDGTYGGLTGDEVVRPTLPNFQQGILWESFWVYPCR